MQPAYLSSRAKTSFSGTLIHPCADPVFGPANDDDMEILMTFMGRCFCGSVEIEVTGSPEAMGYCHCSSCRNWSGGLVSAFSLWKPDAVRISAGTENLALFQKSATSQRQYCSKCGGHLMTTHPPFGLINVFAAVIPALVFRPAFHVNYAETVLPIKDGLPKLMDFPAAVGGSGTVVPE